MDCWLRELQGRKSSDSVVNALISCGEGCAPVEIVKVDQAAGLFCLDIDADVRAMAVVMGGKPLLVINVKGCRSKTWVCVPNLWLTSNTALQFLKAGLKIGPVYH